MEEQKTNKNQGVQVVSRAAAILRLLGRETGGLSLGQIAKHLELPRSTVQRLVAALSEEDFVTSGRSGGIRLGSEIHKLGLAVQKDMRVHMTHLMKDISQRTSETVDLAILKSNRMLFIDQIVGSQRLRTVSSIGETFPLTTTANGKAALALLNRTEARALIRAEIGNIPDASAKENKILDQLDAILNGDLAYDQNEHTDGISALGFARQSANGEIYALSVPVPSSRFMRDKTKIMDAITDCIRNANA